MTTFDRREEAFENLFAHDEEMIFKAEARRAKMIAGWAAGLMHKAEADRASYQDAMVTFTVMNGGAQALFDKIRSDLGAAGIAVTAEQIHERMDTFLAEAIHHVRTV